MSFTTRNFMDDDAAMVEVGFSDGFKKVFTLDVYGRLRQENPGDDAFEQALRAYQQPNDQTPPDETYQGDQHQ